MRVAAGAIARKILDHLSKGKVKITGAIIQIGDSILDYNKWNDNQIEKNNLLNAPEIFIDIQDFNIELVSGGATTEEFVVMNAGEADLNFSIDNESYQWIDSDDGVIRSVSVKKPLNNPLVDPIVLGTFTFKKIEDFVSS